MLELFELGRWENELVESFSHGMKQRLVMCAAFLHRPRAVLVDEPMVGLDPRGARLIKDVFRRMSERGVAILMSTHTLEVAQEMCDRISIILKGKIIARGTVAELRAMAGEPRRAADVGVPASSPAAAGCRRSTRSSDGCRSRFPTCCCRRSGRRATARGGASAATARAAVLFGGVGARRRRRASSTASFWLTGQLADYAELGDYLLRLGLSWLFLTFLSFLAFSGVVTALSTFFLSDDLRLLLAAPVAARRLFHARFLRTVGAGVVDGGRLPRAGAARRRPARAARRRSFYATAIADGRAVRRSSRSRSARRSRCCSSTSFRRAARATS